MTLHRLIERMMLVLGIIALPLSAQIRSGLNKPQTWDGGKTFRVVFGVAQEVVIEGPGRNPAVRFALPKDTLNCSIHEGTGLALTKGPEPKLRPILESIGFNKWFLLGMYDGRSTKENPEPGLPTHILALGDGKFFLVGSSLHPFEYAGARGFFAFGAFDTKGRLKVQSLADARFGFPADLCQKNRKSGEPWIEPSLNALEDLMGWDEPIRTSDHIILVSKHTGIFVVLDERARFKRQVEIFHGRFSSWREEPAPHEDVIIGCQPRSDGSILVATRSRDAVERGMKAYTRSYGSFNPKDPAAWNQQQIAEDLSIRLFPHILWWLVDPATGTVSETSTPLGAPNRLKDRVHLAEFKFHLDPADKFVVGD